MKIIPLHFCLALLIVFRVQASGIPGGANLAGDNNGINPPPGMVCLAKKHLVEKAPSSEFAKRGDAYLKQLRQSIADIGRILKSANCNWQGQYTAQMLNSTALLTKKSVAGQSKKVLVCQNEAECSHPILGTFGTGTIQAVMEELNVDKLESLPKNQKTLAILQVCDQASVKPLILSAMNEVALAINKTHENFVCGFTEDPQQVDGVNPKATEAKRRSSSATL